MDFMVYRGLVNPAFWTKQPGSLVLMIVVIATTIIWYSVMRVILYKQGVEMDAHFIEIPVE